MGLGHIALDIEAMNLENGVYIYHGWYKKFQNGNFQFGKGEFKNLIKEIEAGNIYCGGL